MKSIFIRNPYSPRLGDVLKDFLKKHEDFTNFSCAVAFAKQSGVNTLLPALEFFLSQGKYCDFIIGIDQNGTSYEALKTLSSLNPNLKCYIQHCTNNAVTFHPKFFLFNSPHHPVLITGSGNLTLGGLYTNDEISVLQCLDITQQEDYELYSSACSIIEDYKGKNALLLTPQILEQIRECGEIFREDALNSFRQVLQANQKVTNCEPSGLFFRSEIQRMVPYWNNIDMKYIPEVPLCNQPALVTAMDQLGFVMTLQKTDVGFGQTTAGTARRSPEIFIPLKARDFCPSFWGWPQDFIEDANHARKFDRRTNMLINGEIVSVAMMTWPAKSDFRLRNEFLRKGAEIGDILRIEKTNNQASYQYAVEIIKPQDDRFLHFYNLCSNSIPNSQKRWGYYSPSF